MPLSRTCYGMYTNRAATAALPPSWQGYRLGPARPCFSSVTPAKAGIQACKSSSVAGARPAIPRGKEAREALQSKLTAVVFAPQRSTPIRSPGRGR